MCTHVLPERPRWQRQATGPDEELGLYLEGALEDEGQSPSSNDITVPQMGRVGFCAGY